MSVYEKIKATKKEVQNLSKAQDSLFQQLVEDLGISDENIVDRLFDIVYNTSDEKTDVYIKNLLKK